jgi:formate hydrogenlyase subunit 3/multisubunit Na+/H+ antiporter MnhD subunit
MENLNPMTNNFLNVYNPSKGYIIIFICLCGIPPFPGFFLKYAIIQALTLRFFNLFNV